MPPVRFIAPAKLNLFLHITGKRADGYHLLESMAAFTAFGDELEITPSDTLSLAVEGFFADALQGQNLVLRAAQALKTLSGTTQGAHILLRKHIPVGAGLGGGSADAAATLRALAGFWQLQVSAHTLHEIALPLGSDIPVCLKATPSYIRGIGDEVTPVALPDAWLLLVNPNMPLLTADVYRRFASGFDAPRELPPAFATLDALTGWLAATHNALEAPAKQLMPVIAEMLSAIAATQGCRLSRMSGSGATCFGVYGSEAHASKAAEDIRIMHPSWWIQPTGLHKES